MNHDKMMGRRHEPQCDCNIEQYVSGAREKCNRRYGVKRQRAIEKREVAEYVDPYLALLQGRMLWLGVSDLDWTDSPYWNWGYGEREGLKPSEPWEDGRHW